MSKNYCDCKCGCVAISAVSSFIIGIIAAALTFTATITITPAFLWVAFGISVVYLATVLLTSAFIRSSGIRGCICNTLPALLTGILGTALSSLILLGVGFAATSILGAIIAGILLFFLSLTLTTTACLVKCTLGCTDCDD